MMNNLNTNPRVEGILGKGRVGKNVYYLIKWLNRDI
jgi:hypothetical protein